MWECYSINSVLSVFLLNVGNIHFMSSFSIKRLSFPPERLKRKEKTDNEGRRKLKSSRRVECSVLEQKQSYQWMTDIGIFEGLNLLRNIMNKEVRVGPDYHNQDTSYQGGQNRRARTYLVLGVSRQTLGACLHPFNVMYWVFSMCWTQCQVLRVHSKTHIYSCSYGACSLRMNRFCQLQIAAMLVINGKRFST